MMQAAAGMEDISEEQPLNQAQEDESTPLEASSGERDKRGTSWSFLRMIEKIDR